MFGLLAQAFHSAGPGGVRGHGSRLQIGLNALHPYQSATALTLPLAKNGKIILLTRADSSSKCNSLLK